MALNLIAIPSKFHLTYLPFKGFCPLIKSSEINTVLNLIVLSWGSPLSLNFESTWGTWSSVGIRRGDLCRLFWEQQQFSKLAFHLQPWKQRRKRGCHNRGCGVKRRRGWLHTAAASPPSLFRGNNQLSGSKAPNFSLQQSKYHVTPSYDPLKGPLIPVSPSPPCMQVTGCCCRMFDWQLLSVYERLDPLSCTHFSQRDNFVDSN